MECETMTIEQLLGYAKALAAGPVILANYCDELDAIEFNKRLPMMQLSLSNVIHELNNLVNEYDNFDYQYIFDDNNSTFKELDVEIDGEWYEIVKHCYLVDDDE